MLFVLKRPLESTHELKFRPFLAPHTPVWLLRKRLICVDVRNRQRSRKKPAGLPAKRAPPTNWATIRVGMSKRLM